MSPRRWLPPLSLLFLASSSFGWSDTGHMVIAAIAERDLTPTARHEIARLLGVGDQLGTPYWQAAVWPDEHRTPESSPWHYVNLHFRTDGKRTRNQPEPESVVTAIERFRAVLTDRTKSDADRKLALYYVLHFVGDAHQPLHAVARDTDKYPDGDRGGNEFTVKPPSEFLWMDRPPKNLHALWDMGAGLFIFESQSLSEAAVRRIRAQADTLRAALPVRTFRAADDLRPMDWAKEGLSGAKKVVYRLDENTEPNDSYLTEARRLAAQRATLAGYRLAKVLNAALDPK